ncbi:2-phosphoglycolate phosphatase [Pyrrhoderma noxium]|uniref:4-nitrophenylphosphatase n=1 Tax=Pyrrhoderma noxium TaxID=2282107 RepID=A0A286UDU1_9AGAM|nr:2-phosphoglycolate phosphatase [Pyrrhoderma noxium]
MSVTSQRLSTTKDYQELLDKYDTWLFDCDGVLWRGTTLIDGAKEFLQLLRSKKKDVIFVTNNATNSRASYKTKFDKLGIEAHVDEVFGSAYAAAVYLSSVIKFPKDKKVFVIGQSGLEEELRNEGITYVGGTDVNDNTLEPFQPSSYTPDPSIGAVLCGLDMAINYTKLSKAFIHLNTDPSCLFLATNTDSTYPAQGGVLLPGAGSISAPLRFALGREPLSLGKPSQVMLDCIKAKHNFDPKKTIMVGDRLNTDIQFGKEGGLSTLLVLTGISREEDLAPERSPPAIPDYITNSIGDLRQGNIN